MGNGRHFCAPVLMNMSNITFQVLRLSTFVFQLQASVDIETVLVE